MEKFEVKIGQEQKILLIEPLEVQQGSHYTNRFKILYPDPNQLLVEEDPLKIDEVPIDNKLGEITIRTEKDFDFEGSGIISGDELLGVAAQIVRHPTFNGPK